MVKMEGRPRRGDFIPSDDDCGDPEYNLARERQSVSDSDSSESEEEVNYSTERGRSDCGIAVRGSSAGRSRERGRSVVSVPSSSRSLKKVWLEQQFQTKTLNILEPSYVPNDTEQYSKVNYLKQYFDEELYTIFVEKTKELFRI
ncbi:uncharacterized protein LOC123660317 isoform X2 [Melitaea cinxia]|uniref:uncharacterized protein LOC123660317 isoform X2 n=1 Tax=Melitaea cinxia TaxID=113334 RepID=UPI001E27355F|nr:uncharacterized protein LOC123660317 isoform X2 [Melitaea cinxia]